jgi:hypothetical protein
VMRYAGVSSAALPNPVMLCMSAKS